MIRNNGAAQRNKGPILAALEPRLPKTGTVLEIASGTGQHVVHFARRLTGLTWIPSERNKESCVLINARLDKEKLFNIRTPIVLDALGKWPNMTVDALYTANLTHISAFTVTEALFSGAARILNSYGQLIIYGPFRRNGVHMSQGNVDFDRSLREHNEAWGIREVEALVELAEEAGLETMEVVDMPANNLLLFFRKIA